MFNIDPNRPLDEFFADHINTLATVISAWPLPPKFDTASVTAASSLLFIVAYAMRANDPKLQETAIPELIEGLPKYVTEAVEFRDSILAAVKKYLGQEIEPDDMWPDRIDE